MDLDDAEWFCHDCVRYFPDEEMENRGQGPICPDCGNLVPERVGGDS